MEPDNPDYLQLRDDLEELISLTRSGVTDEMIEQVQVKQAEEVKVDQSVPHWLAKEVTSSSHLLPVIVSGNCVDNRITVYHLYPQVLQQVACEPFQQGHCSFGAKCRYSHGMSVRPSDLKSYETEVPDV